MSTPPPARSEDAWLAAAATRLGGDPTRLRDDAVQLAGAHPVLTTDVLIDGVHFDLARDGGAAAAYKAVAVNLSDLAAVAALPVAYLVGLVLPAPAERALFDALVDGFREASDAFGVPCVGGDTNVARGPLTLAVTAVGQATCAWIGRAGADVGDLLSVTGPLGGSLVAGRHLRPVPRIAEAQLLVEYDLPHAMMDLSDGLSRDLPRLCRASGVGAEIVAADVPIHADARDAPGPPSALERALHDGEDFELLLAHAPLDADGYATLAAAGVRLTVIGRAVAPAEGITLLGPDGPRPLTPGGYDHLAE